MEVVFDLPHMLALKCEEKCVSCVEGKPLNLK